MFNSKKEVKFAYIYRTSDTCWDREEARRKQTRRTRLGYCGL